MAPVFASPDIAALVAAFPPPLPTPGHPSLVRTTSGTTFRDSRYVLENFRHLLETLPSRTRPVDLHSRLGISGKTDWLLACYRKPVHYSRDGQSLLPQSEVDRILNDIVRSEGSCIDAASFATSEDISDRTLRAIIAQGRYSSIYWWQDSGAAAKEYLYGDELTETVRDHVRSRKPSSAEGVDLSQRFENVPAELLLQFATNVELDASLPGGWEILNGRVVFVADTYGADLESKKRKARKAEVSRCADDLRTQGWCRICDSADSFADHADVGQQPTLIELVRDRYAGDLGVAERAKQLTGVSLVGEDGEDVSVLMIEQSLKEALETLRLVAPQEAARVWHAREADETPSTLRELTLTSIQRALASELSRLVLQSSAHLPEIESIIDCKLDDLQALDQSQYHELLTDRLLTVLALYSAGIATIKENLLKQHLEEFLGDHFRRVVIPPLTSLLQHERLMLERSRRRDYDKFQQAVSDAKSLSEIASAAIKLARKLKLMYPPDDTAVRRVKVQTLQQAAKRTRRLLRGSDVLQNLTWILLACHSDGLYISAGRDTTRLIRQYQAVAGNMDIVARLEAWRDELKAGGNDAEILQGMRQMAVDAVNGLVGA